MATERRSTMVPGRANAVTWVTPQRALVACRTIDGRIRLDRLERRLPLVDEPGETLEAPSAEQLDLILEPARR